MSTFAESGLGVPHLHRNGKDSDPLIVLTAAAPCGSACPNADRFRRFPVRLAAAFAQRLFDARGAGAGDQQMRDISAEVFKETHLQDGAGRAMGISDVALDDIDHLDLDN